MDVQTGVTSSVPLHDPVKFDPPPPVAPPTTDPWNVEFSGVPAWSALLYEQALSCIGLMSSEL